MFLELIYFNFKNYIFYNFLTFFFIKKNGQKLYFFEEFTNVFKNKFYF